MPTDSDAEKQEGTFTVLLALGANVGVALLKLIAGLISGSGALLSEAAHSVGDSTTEVLLLVALRRSDKPADRTHPFGYGKERYFWSLLAAVAIFVSGAAFSVFEGLHTILGPDEQGHMLWINYPVLALALILESISFRNAARRVRAESARSHQSVGEYVLNPHDPTVNSIALEDTTAILGLFVAGAGVALHQVTGSQVWDGIASLTIGALLLVAAFLLARACEGLLIGRQADIQLVRAIESRLEEQDEVVDVVDLLTMLVGTGRILVCARVDFVNTLSAGELELACVRIDAALREEFAELDEIFIQPASRSDSTVRERVRQRYGRALAEE
ncbi:MAG: cation transporter [Pseudonocardiales bacterium]|nr:MAG: cation transporter [Pseudonocardiales bacterium]